MIAPRVLVTSYSLRFFSARLGPRCGGDLFLRRDGFVFCRYSCEILAHSSMEALSSRLPPRQIVAGINARFFRGRPSTSLAEAGVLIHIFDNQGDLDGHMYERPGFSETFYSTSVITYRKPQIWNSRTRRRWANHGGEHRNIVRF